MTDSVLKQKPAAEAAAAQEESAGKKRDTPYNLEKFKVLIVEDCFFIAELLTVCLSKVGVGKIFTAESGSSAKEKIATANSSAGSKNLDFIIMDWMMPNGNGETLLKWIRNNPADSIRFLPVLVCSAAASQDTVLQARDLGAHEVLVKPVSAHDLAKRLLHVIDNPRPFVKTADFIGPDRRRRSEPFMGAERRTTKPEDLVQHHERR